MQLRKFTSYEQFKQEFDHEVRAHVQGYIRMGYLLRRAADTGIILQSPYRTVAEFAWAEYHLKPDAVSKMIAVNERYSEGGYSERVAERYSGFGSSLLAEMLTLPESVVNALPDTVTREVIRDVKREMKEEESITPMEVMTEEKEPGQQAMETTLSKFFYQYYRDDRERYIELHDYVASCCERLDGDSREFTQNHLAPAGVGVKMVRIVGIGRFMLSIKDIGQPIELLNMRSGESEKISWSEAYETMRNFCRIADAKKDWEDWYGEPFEVMAETAKEEREEAKELDTSDSPVNTEINTVFAPAQQEETGGGEEQREEVSEVPGKPSEETSEISEGTLEIPEETPKTPKAIPKLPEEVPDATLHQIAIDEIPEVLPPGYIKNGGGVELKEEEKIWKIATEKAERLFNTLSDNYWGPDTGKVVEAMVEESEELFELLNELKSIMKI